MQTQLKDVKHGSFVMYNGKSYMRVNASRNVVPRDEGKVLLVNTANGRLLITDKTNLGNTAG